MALKKISGLKGKAKAFSQEKLEKIKAPKVISGTRFVLFLGDEGAILVHVKENKVLSRQFVADAGEQNLNELRTTLAKDIKAPVLIVIDSMDQTFIQQTLPPVSAVSVKKLIKRRLDRDFGANDIKGAIMLGREKTGRKDWNFMMISLEKSRQLSLWIDFVTDLPNRFLGIYLLSVETENIVNGLERAMGVPKDGTGSQWKFFISHNKVGGYRQVVMRNGRIIFTRLAQPIGEPTPEVIAGNIEQEMLNTMEYMKRLAFDNQTGLDIYIVAAESIKAIFDKSKFNARNFHMLTPYEVSQYLGIEGATQPTDQFGDVILAAAIGSSRSHILTLTTPESRRFDKLYHLSQMQRMGGAGAAFGLVVYAAVLAYGIYSGYSEQGELEQSQITHQRNLEALRDEVKQSKLDVEQTGDLIDLYQMLLKQRVSPLAFIDKSENVIKSPIVVKAFDWMLGDKGVAAIPASTKSSGKSGGAAKAVAGPKMTAVFTLQFPGVADLESFRVVSKLVLGDIKKDFPNYDVAFTRIPSKFSESEKLDMTFTADTVTQKVNNKAPELADVQLTIKEK